MASLDFEREKSNFREYYDTYRNTLYRAGSQLESLIAALTSSIRENEEPTVVHRIKDREECIKKFARKYQTALESTRTEYEIKDHITDLVGLRVICYYEVDIPRVVDLLRKNFTVIEETNKSAELEAQENAFGYKGHHLDVKISSDRSSLPEYKDYLVLRFEVQVRSTIQDAWSTLDHKIKYKKSIPHELKRQINALAALFEIADREFTNIRDLTDKFERIGAVDAAQETAIMSISGAAEPKSLDVFEFIAIAQRFFPSYQFHGYKSDGFVQEVNHWDDSVSASIFLELMERNLPKVEEYSEYQKEVLGNDLNPFTRIRHALYLHDPKAFNLVLYDIQRSTFEKWLKKPGEEDLLVDV